MSIEPLSTILAWVIGICSIIFILVSLVFYIIFIISFIRDFYEKES